MDSVNVDNDSLKAKIRSCNTLNTFYHETRQQMDTLNKQIIKRDNLIADLKAKLGKYERIDINVEGQESVVIGPSTCLIESLCKEICKIKQQFYETQVNTSHQAELSQQEIQRLKQQLREKERELETVTLQPEHEKDEEIQRLRGALEEKDRAQATRAVLCNSLVEEADQLRAQLAATVRVCQELLGRLEKEKKGGVTEEEQTQQRAKQMSDGSQEALVKKLQEQNRQLKHSVAHVEALNAKWQKYDASREEYVRGLCQRLKEFSAQATSSTSPVEGPGPRPGSGSGLVPGLASPSSGLLQKEIARLNGLLEEKMRDCGRLGRDLEGMRRKNQECIQTLEQQVLIYTEDFKSERADRERAQGTIQDLKEEVSRLQQQLHAQSRGKDATATCRVHTGVRVSPHRRMDTAQSLLRTSTDLPVPKHQTSQSAAAQTELLVPAWMESRGLSELQCPRCFTTFDENQATEYLNHCEECARL
ncbi:TNFAIP3-interacting protein 2 [Osmerus eperlanus]|uniref:TNFAIP3-interacting protein 2 n=1 Tax=Osmerus eperlanus TaxID=29151 RepID=UPI002E110D30